MDAYYILNASKAPEITPAWLEKVRYALELQNHTDFCPMWESQPKDFFVPVDGAAIPTRGARVFHLVDSIPEAPDALAYHTVDADGRPVLRLGVEVIRSNSGDLLAGLESAMSHEVCETEADPYVEWNADMPDGKSDTPIECCDWTQGDTYIVAGCTMSNFVGPRFFSSSSEGPYDRMGLCTKPFELRPQGYYVKRTGGPGGHQRQVFGERCPEYVRKHAAEHSRAAIRMRGKSVADNYN